MGALMDLCVKHGIAISYVLTSPRTGAIDASTVVGKSSPGDMFVGKPWRHLTFDVTLTRKIEPGGHERTYGPTSYRMGLKDPPRGYGEIGFFKETREYDRYLKTRVPEVDVVLHCLISDGESYELARDFDDFCSSFGYSNDSIKARNNYRACGETAKRVRSFLGELYSEIAEAAHNH